MYTTVQDMIDALSKYPPDTLVFGLANHGGGDSIVANAAIQDITSLDSNKHHLLLYWFDDEKENRSEIIPQSGLWVN